MRTRLLPILCVLALLLSACTADGKPSVATASVPVSGPTDETAAPTAPTAEPAPDPSGSVTPGGWQVYTDPSAYRPAKKRIRRATCAAQASTIGSASLSGGTNPPFRSPKTLSVVLM